MAPAGGQERLRRRKISLACEPCRERKSRCDGVKPICSTCTRRSLPMERCVYKLDNARTASTDEYIKVLHDRIRRLEQVCTDNNVDIPPLDGAITGDEEVSAKWNADALRTPAPSRRFSSNSNHPFHGLDAQTPILSTPLPSAYLDLSTRDPTLTLQPSPNLIDANDPTSSTVTAMGTATAEDDASSAEDFFGSSSTASFLKELFESMKVPQPRVLSSMREPGIPLSALPKESTTIPSVRRDVAYYVQAQNYSLPPRDLADHLLDRYRQHVYYLYPFFHLPSFEHAYRSLWQSTGEPAPTPFNVGLGSHQEADATTILFHCALNAIFSHACHFSDLPPSDRLLASYTFFMRSKSFVGLELIEANNLAVVQVFLIIALALQSTPYPSRVWNAAGIACRVAQGLGLHTEHRHDRRQGLEKEIRRRAWYGCVIMDLLVSMTYGRPAMATMVSSLPLPSGIDENPSSALQAQPGASLGVKFRFFTESIRLCGILEEIITLVYQPWLNRGKTDDSGSIADAKAYNSVDRIISLHTKLSKFEASVTSELSWKKPVPQKDLLDADHAVLNTQRTVLHARFIYLRIMLLRPILTQLTVDEREQATSGTVSTDPLVAATTLHCAQSCVQAAVELLELIHSNYQMQSSDAWWWNALYASTSGIVLIVAQTSSSLQPTLNPELMTQSWKRCQEILRQIASFSETGQQSLKLLQSIHSRVCSSASNHSHRTSNHQAGGDGKNSNNQNSNSNSNDTPSSDRESISTDMANAILHSMPLDFNTVDFGTPGANGFQGLANTDMMSSFFNFDTTLFGNPSDIE